MSTRRDLTNYASEYFKVIAFDEIRNRTTYWLCECLCCGKIKSIPGGNVVKIKSFCCGKSSSTKASIDNKELNETLKRQWSSNNIIVFYEAKSHSHYFWLCLVCNNEWRATLKNRRLGRDCPYCSNQKVCKENCLATRYPELSLEWSPSNLQTPYDIVKGGKRKIIWKCSFCQQEWSARIENRLHLNQGCPRCASSKLEASIRKILQYNHISFEEQYRVPRNIVSRSHDLRLDFLVEYSDVYIGIEAQGKQHYVPTAWSKTHDKDRHFDDVQRRDKEKRNMLKALNIPLLEIPYWETLTDAVLLSYLEDLSSSFARR